MNRFCLYCTGNNKEEIKECDDKYCPFYAFRSYNLDYQIPARPAVRPFVRRNKRRVDQKVDTSLVRNPVLPVPKDV